MFLGTKSQGFSDAVTGIWGSPGTPVLKVWFQPVVLLAGGETFSCGLEGRSQAAQGGCLFVCLFSF